MATPQQETKPEPAGTSPETRWRKKPVVVTAITFDELVAHGIARVPAEQLHNGLPWSFDYKGHPITHETDDCYLIPVLGGTVRFERGDLLITGVAGELYPCKSDIFAATYDPVTSEIAVNETPVHPSDAFGFFRSYHRHVAFVRVALGEVIHNLERRSLEHDTSKLLDDEFAGFTRINAHARVHKFGSPEYAAGLKQEKGTIALHFARNSHHAEFFAGVDQAAIHAQWAYDPGTMGFLDVIEMVCDWWGARRGYDDARSWEATVQLNLEQKGKFLQPWQLELAKDVGDWLAQHVPESASP